MSIATLIYNATPNKLGSLQVDCTSNETHTAENDVTEFPVEGTADMTDHIRPKQDGVTITGLFTGTPTPAAPRSGTATYTSSDGSSYEFTSSDPDASAERSVAHLEAARASLYRMRNAGELVTVVTGFRTYDNMAIKSLTFTIDTTVAFGFTAVLVQVQVAELKTVRIATRTQPSAKAKSSEGKKPLGPDDYVSVAKKGTEKGIDFVKGFFNNFGGAK